MKVYEMELNNLVGEGQTLWIATDRKLTIPEGSGITDLHEIDVVVSDGTGIDLIIK